MVNGKLLLGTLVCSVALFSGGCVAAIVGEAHAEPPSMASLGTPPSSGMSDAGDSLWIEDSLDNTQSTSDLGSTPTISKKEIAAYRENFKRKKDLLASIFEKIEEAGYVVSDENLKEIKSICGNERKDIDFVVFNASGAAFLKKSPENLRLYSCISKKLDKEK
ncbi:MAG: hypothetical protein LBI26_00630 [Holosporales bacterium]|jgi:hypothetical protein|nr:hypothetical protein [Holosporales bacterium]